MIGLWALWVPKRVVSTFTPTTMLLVWYLVSSLAVGTIHAGSSHGASSFVANSFEILAGKLSRRSVARQTNEQLTVSAYICSPVTR